MSIDDRSPSPEDASADALDGAGAPRKGPEIIMPDAATQDALAAFEAVDAPPAPPWRPLRSIAMAFLLATVGAILWAVVVAISRYELGLIAIVVGLLAGTGAASGGRGRGAQVVGALAGAYGYFFGQILCFIALIILTGELANVDAPPPSPDEPAAAESAAAESSESKEAVWPKDGAEWILVIVVSIIGTFTTTFTSFSLVICAIAIYEGFRIPAAHG